MQAKHSLNAAVRMQAPFWLHSSSELAEQTDKACQAESNACVLRSETTFRISRSTILTMCAWPWLHATWLPLFECAAACSSMHAGSLTAQPLPAPHQSLEPYGLLAPRPPHTPLPLPGLHVVIPVPSSCPCALLCSLSASLLSSKPAGWPCTPDKCLPVWLHSDRHDDAVQSAETIKLPGFAGASGLPSTKEVCAVVLHSSAAALCSSCSSGFFWLSQLQQPFWSLWH